MAGSDETISFSGFECILMGGIFMSNRKTKKECLRRQLFGLPSQHEGFVKKVRAGMILFLFEYEERKLYGVFEATSDGGSNIVPNAFCSSGKLFSAQVHCKRLWHCKPVSEAEFSDAIKENYYTPQKFSFALSGAQVLRLLCLFNSRKICCANNFMKESPINFRSYHGISHPCRKGTSHFNRGHSVHFREPFLGREVSTLKAQCSPAAISPDNIHSGPLLQSQEDKSFPRNTHDSSVKGPRSSLEVPRFLHKRPATYISLSINRESQHFPRDAFGTDSDPQCCQCQSSLHSCCLRYSYHSLDLAGGAVHLPDQQLCNSQIALESGNSLQSHNLSNMKCSSGSSSYDVYIPHSTDLPVQSASFVNQKSGSPIPLNNLSSQVPNNSYPLEGWQISGSNALRQWGVDTLPSLPGADHFGTKFFGTSVQYSPNEEHICYAPVNDYHLKSLFGEDRCHMVPPISLGVSVGDQQINAPKDDVMGPQGAMASIEPVTNGHGELYADIHHRVSVFSRLSKSPNAEWIPNSKQRIISSNPDSGISFEQVVEMLAERRSYWQTVNTDGCGINTNIPFAETSWINYPFVEVMPKTNVPLGQYMPKINQPGRYMKGWGRKPFHARSAENWSGNDANLQNDEDSASVIKGPADKKDMVDDGEAQQFINFKRRSEVQKAGDGAVTDGSTENKSDECSPGNLKRRKLVRPSFCKDVPEVNSKGNMIDSTNGEEAGAGSTLSTNVQSHESVNQDMLNVVKNEKVVYHTGSGANICISCLNVKVENQIVEVPNVEEKKINAGTDSLVEPGSSASNREENVPKLAVCDVPGRKDNKPVDEDSLSLTASVRLVKFQSHNVQVPNIGEKVTAETDSLSEAGSSVSNQEKKDSDAVVRDAVVIGGKHGNGPADENSVFIAVSMGLVKVENQNVEVANIEVNKMTAGTDSLAEPRSSVSNREKNEFNVSVCDVSAVEGKDDESVDELPVSALVSVGFVEKVEVAN